MRLPAVLILAAVAALASVPAAACGCGIALKASVTNERALVIDRPGREEIIASFDLLSKGGGRAAIVLPVPSDPEVEEIERGDPLAYLDAATAPKLGGGDAGPAGAAPPGDSGVDVIGRDRIGGFDVSRLEADDPRALDDWLDQNGYRLPQAAVPILADYVKERWRFVAIRLASGMAGTTRPLRVAFDTDRPVYPMRLTQLATEPVDVTLYVLADGRRTAKGLDVVWDGALSELDPPPLELRDLFDDGSHLTKLTATAADPGRFKSDLVIRGGAVVAPSDDSPWWGAAIALACALLGGALLLFSRTR